MDDYIDLSMDNSMNYDNGNSGFDAMSDNTGMLGDDTNGAGLTPFENSILDGLDSTTYNPLVSNLPLDTLPLDTTMTPVSPLSNPLLNDNITPTYDTDSPMKIYPMDRSSNVNFGYTCVCCGHSYGDD